jgi:hypothetical protein
MREADYSPDRHSTASPQPTGQESLFQSGVADESILPGAYGAAAPQDPESGSGWTVNLYEELRSDLLELAGEFARARGIPQPDLSPGPGQTTADWWSSPLKCGRTPEELLDDLRVWKAWPQIRRVADRTGWWPPCPFPRRLRDGGR